LHPPLPEAFSRGASLTAFLLEESVLNEYIYNLLISTWFEEIETYILHIENIFDCARIDSAIARLNKKIAGVARDK
jgi:hypothetical protein